MNVSLEHRFALYSVLSCTSVRVSEQWHKKNNNGNVRVRCDVDRA